MAFQIHQLDKLDYDEVEPLLEDYIDDAIEAFASSKIGKAHIKLHPQGGNWIGTFIEMAYIYGGHSLPKMTKGSAQEVMEYILPRKLTLLDPSDTDDAIAELVAFWTFLDDVYRLRSAKAIAKYLQSIEDKFPQWMFDPSRGGMAKQFLMQGTEAGFDMTTEAGVQAFKAEYNQRIQANPAEMPLSPVIPMTTPPPDMQQAFEQLGLELPPVGQPVGVMALMKQFLGAVEQLDPDTIEQLMATMEADPTNPTPLMENEPFDLRADLLRQNLSEAIPLAEADEALLQAQIITMSEPGNILQDFQTVLEFIGTQGIPVSSKLQHLSLKLLGELNDQLSSPIKIDLKRPQQKSYPNIHALYLLLRATGITRVVAKGKQSRLVLNPEIYESWQQLNPTEQYCSLLEAWFIRAHPEMLGEERSGPLGMGERCLQYWSQLTQKKGLTFAQYSDQDRLNYWPGLVNVALLGMFGLIRITSGKPSPGKGWRIKKLEALPWGKALISIIHNAYLTAQYQWSAATDPTQPFGDLQPELQPYFPEWQQNLGVVSLPFRPGRHIFKVSLGEVWRRIAISGEATLADLSRWILNAVDFDHDHLDQFTYKSLTGLTVEVLHPYAEGDLSTTEVTIGSLPIHEGSTMEYLFDFGDCWKFQVQLEAVESEPAPDSSQGVRKVKRTKRRKSGTRKPVGEILEVHGKAPPQYPDYDEE